MKALALCKAIWGCYFPPFPPPAPNTHSWFNSIFNLPFERLNKQAPCFLAQYRQTCRYIMLHVWYLEPQSKNGISKTDNYLFTLIWHKRGNVWSETRMKRENECVCVFVLFFFFSCSGEPQDIRTNGYKERDESNGKSKQTKMKVERGETRREISHVNVISRLFCRVTSCYYGDVRWPSVGSLAGRALSLSGRQSRTPWSVH